jgi:iron complex transport system permease protein
VIVLGGRAGAVSGVLAAAGVPTAALVGGLATGVALYLLARRQGLDGYRTVLVGIGLTAVGSNLVYWLLTVGEVDIATRATTWLVGSLGESDWSRLLPVAVALAVLVPVTLAASRTIAALQFGEDTALALGVRVDAARGALLLLATGLAAVAVSAAGPVGFVALAAPQIAMRAALSPRPPLLGSVVFGALLVTVADLAVRVVPLFDGLPVGVLTAVLGAPYLAFLFLRSRREVRT